jgi:hypothetical protein
MASLLARPDETPGPVVEDAATQTFSRWSVMDQPGIGNCKLKRGIHMVTVTDAAGAHLAQLLDKVKAQEDTVIRLVLDESDMVPKMDQARAGDTAFSYEGRRSLVLDALVVQAMADKTLDVQDAEDGLKIVLR